MWSWFKHLFWKCLGYEVCTVCEKPLEGMVFTDPMLRNYGHKECLLLARLEKRNEELVLIDNEKKRIQ